MPENDHNQNLSFAELDLQPEVLQALDEMGFKSMTPIQQQAIPKIMSGMDFLGQAPTGTGKTAGFGIPIVNSVKPGAGYVQALIVAPTRELAIQITKEIGAIGRIKGVKVLAVYGGQRIYGQKETLRDEDIDVVVGTPGRLIDHIQQMSLPFTKTRLVVLDEADEMLDMGFRDDIDRIMRQLPQGRQTLLFSATISKEIRQIADTYMMYPEEVRIKPQQTSAELIDQSYVVLNPEEKPDFIKKLLETESDLYGIVFCRTKKDTVEVGRKFRDKYPVEAIHGAMPQEYRNKIMEAFRGRKFKLLVATDVLARGIDIDDLTHIINYMPPDDPESYIHRIGRTARQGKTGIAITLFTPNEKREFEHLQRHVGMPLEKHPESELEFSERRGGSGRGRGGYGRGRGRSGGGGRDESFRGRSRNRSRGRKHGRGKGGAKPKQD